LSQKVKPLHKKIKGNFFASKWFFNEGKLFEKIIASPLFGQKNLFDPMVCGVQKKLTLALKAILQELESVLVLVISFGAHYLSWCAWVLCVSKSCQIFFQFFHAQENLSIFQPSIQ
jgi:hypothetical protein